MKPLILSAATILTIGLISTTPALAQSQRLTCVRDRNMITCPNYGSFQYSSNQNNKKRANISCHRDRNVINCPNYGSFRYSSNNNNNDWSSSNSTINNDLNTLYIQVLGRNANANDLNNYNNQGWSLTQVRSSLANSQEFNQVMNNVYQQYLGRNADPNGLQSYRNAIINGRSFEDVRNEVANSPEARNRNQNNGNYNNGNYNNGNYNNGNYNQPNDNSNEINNLYIQVLGRNANANDLRNYNQAINGRGLSFEQARRNLVSSQEFNQSINQIYQEYLGRNADSKGLQSYRNAVMNGRSFEEVRNEIANSPEANKRNDNYYNNDNYNNGNQPNNGSGDFVQNMLCQLAGVCF